jgi:hypothetical protein
MRPPDFEASLAAIPSGYSEGRYGGQLYGATLHRSEDGKRVSLFARQLAGNDIVSFNFYRLNSGEVALKPCEMPREKVEAFVLGYAIDKRPSSEADQKEETES